MSVFSNVIKPQGLEPLQFPTKFLSHSGLEAPPQSLGLEFKPYAIGDLASDATSSPRISNDLGGDVGLDVKYAVTQNLTVDITYNTDFAQVEADDQQINLTRFNLFFPEKREFFLENQGTFSFGGPGDINLPILFHSRQIGLSQGRPVPIQIGGRLTGRLGPFTLGLLSTRTDEEPVLASPPTTFSAVRIKRDILRKSSVGVIFTRRSARQTGPGTNEALRHRCLLRVLRQPDVRHLLGSDAYCELVWTGYELSAECRLRRRPVWYPIGAPQQNLWVIEPIGG